MPMKNPPHPGDLIRTEIIEELGLTVKKSAEILKVRRATLSDLLQAVRRSKREQQLAQLVGHRAGHTFGVVVVMQRLEAFVAKPAEMHVTAFLHYVR